MPNKCDQTDNRLSRKQFSVSLPSPSLSVLARALGHGQTWTAEYGPHHHRRQTGATPRGITLMGRERRKENTTTTVVRTAWKLRKYGNFELWCCENVTVGRTDSVPYRNKTRTQHIHTRGCAYTLSGLRRVRILPDAAVCHFPQHVSAARKWQPIVVR